MLNRTAVALIATVMAQAAAADNRLYANRDHYIQLPSDWYSYNHFRIGAAYAYANEDDNQEADGIAPTIDFTVPFADSNVYFTGGAFATRLKDVEHDNFDYWNAHLALGLHEPFTPWFDGALEVGPAVVHQAEDGAFGPEDGADVEVFARAVGYFKIINALDLRTSAGVMGDPFGDISLDFRISRGFSIAPTITYRDIDSQDLWAFGITLGFHFDGD